MKRLITILFIAISATCFGQRVQQFGQHGLRKYIPLLQVDSIQVAHLDSVGTATGGCVFRDAATGFFKIGPCGGSGGSDTLKVIQQGSGYSAISTLSPDTLVGKTYKVDNGLTGSVDSDSTRHFVLGGTISSDRTFSMGSNRFIFQGTSSPLVLRTNSGTVNYSLGVNGSAPFYYQQGWTNASSSYTRGFGLAVDTFNNTYTGGTTSNYPTYSSGGTFVTAGPVVIGSGEYAKYNIVSTNTTLDNTYNIVFVDATSGNVTITLPAVSAVSTLATNTGYGLKYTIKRIDASGNTVTIQRAGSDLIDGASSFTLSSLQVKKIQAANTSNWYVISN